MTDIRDQLTETRDIYSLTTPGEWHTGKGLGNLICAEADNDLFAIADTEHPEDAEFIVHARTALPRYAAALDAVLELCDKWEAESNRSLKQALVSSGPDTDQADMLGKFLGSVASDVRRALFISQSPIAHLLGGDQ